MPAQSSSKNSLGDVGKVAADCLGIFRQLLELQNDFWERIRKDESVAALTQLVKEVESLLHRLQKNADRGRKGLSELHDQSCLSSPGVIRVGNVVGSDVFDAIFQLADTIAGEVSGKKTPFKTFDDAYGENKVRIAIDIVTRNRGIDQADIQYLEALLQPYIEPRPVSPPPRNGPTIHGFRWDGQEHKDIAPIPGRLIAALWDRENYMVDIDFLADQVWGDELELVTKDQIQSARREANRFFERCAIPLRVHVSKRKDGPGMMVRLTGLDQE